MTSKNLYFNLFKENLKRRVGLIALGMLTFFFTLPVAAAMVLGNNANELESMGYTHDYLEIMESVIGNNNAWLVFVTCIFAVIFAIQGFGYVFSKNKIDLYHSAPVKREKLFIITFVNGILVYIIPYMINLLLSFLIAGVYGSMSVSIAISGLCTMVSHLVFYFLMYSTIVLAIMLTGNIVVSLLGSMVFIFYGPAFHELINGYIRTFFYSYSYYSGKEMSSINRYLSPFFAYMYDISGRMYQYDSGTQTFGTMLGALAAGGVFVVISVILYKKRPSEMAGKSMVFRITKPIIKILLMIPLALAGGLFFKSAVSYSGDGWLIFGTIVGLLLSHCIVEIIYEFDLKAVKTNLKQIWIPAVAVVVIACIFRFDMFGYDSYLPEKEEIESISVSAENYNRQYMEYFERDENGVIRYCSMDEYGLNNMKLTDLDTIYPILESGIAYNKKQKNGTKDDFDAYYFMPVKYQLKNGESVYRSYRINEQDNPDNLNTLYKSKEYKEGAYLIYAFSEEELSAFPFQWTEMEDMESNNNLNIPYYNLSNISKEEKIELVKVYKEELYQLNYESTAAENIVGRIQMSVEGKNDADLRYQTKRYENIYANVYSEFEKTIELLERYSNK